MNETRIENTNQKTKFSRWNIERKNTKSFEEDPKIRVAGKEISLKDYQNGNAEDTNIYKVLEKYRGDLKMTQAQLHEQHVYLSDELARINNLPDALAQIKEGEKAWNSLPKETREHFGYSINNFLKNGKSYVDTKISEYNKKIQEENKKMETLIQQAQQAQQGVINNG